MHLSIKLFSLNIPAIIIINKAQLISIDQTGSDGRTLTQILTTGAALVFVSACLLYSENSDKNIITHKTNSLYYLTTAWLNEKKMHLYFYQRPMLVVYLDYVCNLREASCLPVWEHCCLAPGNSVTMLHPAFSTYATQGEARSLRFSINILDRTLWYSGQHF